MDKIHLEDLNIKEFEEKWQGLSPRFPEVQVNVTPSSQDYMQLMVNVADLLNVDEVHVVNYTKLEIIMMVEAIKMFTNIEFTEEELSDYSKLYDRLAQNGLIEDFTKTILDVNESFFYIIEEQIHALYDYNASAYGIMEGLTEKYKNTEFDIEKLNEELKDENSIPLIKEIMDKLG